MSSRKFAAPLLLATLLTTACEDELDFGFGDWAADPDTVTLYTLDRPEYQGLPAAFDIIEPTAGPVRVEDRGVTGGWDFALTGGVDGEPLRLTPFGAVLDVNSQAGIAVVPELSFDEIELAPSDTTRYVTRTSAAVDADSAYVVRSRAISSAGGGCIKFAKLELLEVDPVAGTVRLVALGNPNCNDRSLVPTEDE